MLRDDNLGRYLDAELGHLARELFAELFRAQRLERVFGCLAFLKLLGSHVPQPPVAAFEQQSAILSFQQHTRLDRACDGLRVGECDAMQSELRGIVSINVDGDQPRRWPSCRRSMS